MKKMLLLGVLILSGITSTLCIAQDSPVTNNAGSSNQGVRTIFSFKTEIGLTDDQENKLKALLYDEQNSINTLNDSLKSLGGELAKLIENKSDMAVIKSKLEEIAKIQVEISCVNIEDGRKVETILTPDQITKWKNIQQKFSAQNKATN